VNDIQEFENIIIYYSHKKQTIYNVTMALIILDFLCICAIIWAVITYNELDEIFSIYTNLVDIIL